MQVGLGHGVAASVRVSACGEFEDTPPYTAAIALYRKYKPYAVSKSDDGTLDPDIKARIDAACTKYNISDSKRLQFAIGG